MYLYILLFLYVLQPLCYHKFCLLLGDQDFATFSRKKTENRQESASSSDDSKSSPSSRRILNRKRKRSTTSVTLNAEDDDEMVHDSSASDQSIESKDDEVMNAENAVKEKKISNRKGSWERGICGKTLTSKWNLVRHIRTHTGKDPTSAICALEDFLIHRPFTATEELTLLLRWNATFARRSIPNRQRHLPLTHQCEFRLRLKFTTFEDLKRHRDGRKGRNPPCNERRGQLAKK